MKKTQEPIGPVAERAIAVRKAFGWSQLDASKEMGFDKRETLSKVETGKNQARTADWLIAFRKTYGVTMEDANAYLTGKMSLDEFLSRSSRYAVKQRGTKQDTDLFDRAVARADASPRAVEGARAVYQQKSLTLLEDGWIQVLRMFTELEKQAILKAENERLRAQHDAPKRKKKAASESRETPEAPGDDKTND